MSRRREKRRARWGGAGWDLLFLAGGVPEWFGAMAMLALWSKPVRQAVHGVSPDFLLRFLLSVALVLLVLMTVTPVLTGWQRRRFHAFRGIEIPDVPTPRLHRGGIRRALVSEALWRQVVYHLVAGPLIGLTLILLLYMTAVAGFVGFQFSEHVLGLGGFSGGITDAAGKDKFWAQLVYLAVTGTALAFAPRLLRLLVGADEFAARRLLGPSETVALEHRVRTLADSRAATVEAADAERRRIERDLHDGAQQRLMSLAVHLGIARKTLTDTPPEAMAVIVDAHEQVRQAMAEIRNLVRGLHPAVLDDRGLDAALSGVAARSAVPVRLTVGATGALSASVETVAYFVVSEALANVVKHSRASQAAVDVAREADTLLVRVTDDGVGGADARGGTGLTGLAQRVASVDGRLRLTSPSGGPTVLTAELPCGV